MKRVHGYVYSVVSHQYFWLAVLGLAIFQGLWYALSFGPILFDETRHLNFIFLYTDYVGPFINTQTQAMDHLGQVTREPSYLYYYLMSLPLRVIKIFVTDYTAQVVILRIINMGFFITALIIFKKIFLEIGLSRAVSNLTLLLFILIPTVAPLAGVVTYDVGVLPVIALLVLLSVRIYKNKRISSQEIVLLIILSIAASVIKYTALPVVVAIVAILSVQIFKARGSAVLGDIKKTYISSSVSLRIAMALGLLLAILVFIERPALNIINHSALNPSCLKTLPAESAKERCAKNYVYERNIRFAEAKPEEFVPVNPIDYFFGTWLKGMVVSSTRQVPAVPYLPIITAFIYISVVAGVTVILLALRELLSKYKVLWVLLIVMLVYVGAVYYSNYTAYTRLGQPVAISARYLMPILPIMIVLLAMSIKSLARRNYYRYAPFLLLITILAFSQGGGLTSYILYANNGYYWQRDTVIKANQDVKHYLERVIKE